MEDTDLPAFVLAERDALLADIYEVFVGVTRQGGVSWGEADVIDDYGSPEQRAAARAKDRDTRWEDLLEDPNWDPANYGEWSFLDAIGFRYYLSAAMVVAVRQGWDSGILFHLTLPVGELRDYKGAQWAALSLPQRLCVKRFLQYMGIVDAYADAVHREREYVDGWFGALRSYWGRITDSEAVSEDDQSVSKRRRRKRES